MQKGKGDFSPFPFYLLSIERVNLALANLGELNLGRSYLTLGNELTSQRACLVVGYAQSGAEVALGILSVIGGQIVEQSLLNGSVFKLSLRGLVGAVCVAVVELLDGGDGELLDFIGQLALGNSGVELTISHSIFLSALCAWR